MLSSSVTSKLRSLYGTRGMTTDLGNATWRKVVREHWQGLSELQRQEHDDAVL